MNKRWILALFIVWIALHLIWLATWLLGVVHPVPRVLGAVIGVIDIFIVVLIAVYLIRAAIDNRAPEEEV